MRAQNLTISIPSKGCDKNCPYCISKMTGFIDTNSYLFKSNMKKVKTIANAAQVASVLITGKGEPFLNLDDVKKVCRYFEDFPIEIQTNGIYLKKRFYENRLSFLDYLNINTIAFSIDCTEYWKTLKELFEAIKDFGIIARVTLNVTNDLGTDSFEDILAIAEDTGTDQLSIRNVMIPYSPVDTVESKAAVKWIMAHLCEAYYFKISSEMTSRYCADGEDNLVRELPFGAKVYDIHGIAVTTFPECLQHSHKADDIRSLIYQEDGHMYTSWDSPASILF